MTATQLAEALVKDYLWAKGCVESFNAYENQSKVFSRYSKQQLVYALALEKVVKDNKLKEAEKKMQTEKGNEKDNDKEKKEKGKNERNNQRAKERDRDRDKQKNSDKQSEKEEQNQENKLGKHPHSLLQIIAAELCKRKNIKKRSLVKTEGRQTISMRNTLKRRTRARNADLMRQQQANLEETLKLSRSSTKELLMKSSHIYGAKEVALKIWRRTASSTILLNL